MCQIVWQMNRNLYKGNLLYLILLTHGGDIIFLSLKIGTRGSWTGVLIWATSLIHRYCNLGALCQLYLRRIITETNLYLMSCITYRCLNILLSKYKRSFTMYFFWGGGGLQTLNVVLSWAPRAMVWRKLNNLHNYFYIDLKKLLFLTRR